MNIQIANFEVGSSRTFVIAEIGNNHNGSYERAIEMVDHAVEVGADCAKFQMRHLDEVYRQRTLRKDGEDLGTEYVLDLLRRFELTVPQHKQLADYCGSKGILYLCTPWDQHSVDILEGMKVAAYKVASADLTNLPLLEYAARFKKPMIISTGMATMKEIEEAVAFVKKAGNDKIIVLQCTTDYPAKNKEINLRAMETMRRKLKTLVGFSDHTLGTLASLAAVSLGASAIEKHMTLSKKLPGPDQKASLEPDEFKLMTEKIRQIPVILGSALKKPMPSELAYRPLVRKSIVVFRNIRKGEKLSLKNLAIKRPGTGLQPKFLSKVLGKTAKKNIAKDDFIRMGVIK